jgi:hypothetical protein
MIAKAECRNLTRAGLVAASAIMAAFFSVAQVKESNSAAPAKRQAEVKPTTPPNKQFAIDLLKRSHALANEVDEQRRIGLLSSQISAAGRVDKTLARDWAHELFNLGASGAIRSPSSHN